MRKNKFFYSVTIGLGLSLILAASAAQATLGGPAGSIKSDASALRGARRTVRTQKNYTIHEITTAAVTIREYVSPGGVVFGIAWNGIAYPDLTKLLGCYAGEYAEARRRMPRAHGRKPLRVKTGNIVVEKWGHMRDLHGRAYVPALIPDGVSASDIR
ncbi:MAG: DUF2844 domain-containing protein [Nitrospiraceae bacterium]|nr:DUF2844 domain-containing protein [Nitrospiraceae bacterium]